MTLENRKLGLILCHVHTFHSFPHYSIQGGRDLDVVFLFASLNQNRCLL